jgi:hypothetical protein
MSPTVQFPSSNASAARTIGATVSGVIPRFSQYDDFNQSARARVPLLALQATQHRTMFSRVTSEASLMMCSHEGALHLAAGASSKLTPQ